MPCIGVDLGASKAVMAALHRGEPEVILSRAGSPLTPAALALDAAAGLACGHAALEQAQTVPLPLPRLGEPATVAFNGLEYTPGELVALFLARLREEIAAACGAPAGRAVLAVPLAFGQRQRAALQQAARRAGILALGVVPSPIAAALAYSRRHPEAAPRTLLVVDFGASALGVAVLRAFPGALSVLGQAAESWLGGEDLTQSIVAWLLLGLQGRRGLLLDESQEARQALRSQLRQAAERAKVALSIVEQAAIVLAPEDLGLAAGIDEAMTRAQFEGLIRPRLEEAWGVVEQALADAGLAADGIDAVLLAGGSAQVPLWQALLRSRLRRARFLADLNPLTCVAVGAALAAGALGEVRCPICGLQSPLESLTCRRCGAALTGGPRLACPRCFLPNEPGRAACWKCGTSLRPAGRVSRAETHGPPAPGTEAGLRCLRCGLAAPVGASSCPGCGEVIAPFVGCLSPSSLGVERDGGRMDVILPRGQALPTPQPVHRAFAAGSGAASLQVPLYEGDKPFACQNVRCATLHVALPEPPATAASVRVAFTFDRDGLLTALATAGDGSERELDAWLEWQ